MSASFSKTGRLSKAVAPLVFILCQNCFAQSEATVPPLLGGVECHKGVKMYSQHLEFDAIHKKGIYEIKITLLIFLAIWIFLSKIFETQENKDSHVCYWIRHWKDEVSSTLHLNIRHQWYFLVVVLYKRRYASIIAYQHKWRTSF